MKNYYEILEVDKNASKEIIEKAYKTLAKKYHPDVQEASKKTVAEEKMKLINEAYSTLSDEYKKEEYDKQLEDDTISKEEYQEIVQENIELKRKIQSNLNNNNTKINQQYTNYNQYQNNRVVDNKTQNNNSAYNKQAYEEQINKAVNKAYYDAYIRDLKNRGYRIKYKKTFKEYIKDIIAFGLTLIIFYIICQIPFVKKYFINLYEENLIIRNLIDFFKGAIKTNI